MQLSFRSISQPEAKDCIAKWHYAGTLNRGQQFYGAFWDDDLIACTVFDDNRFQKPRITEFMACGKRPFINNRIFQMSALIAYSTKQLNKTYDLAMTYCELHRKGSIFKGAAWHYSGIKGPYHEYWKPLNRAGNLLACEIGLESLEYPR